MCELSLLFWSDYSAAVRQQVFLVWFQVSPFGSFQNVGTVGELLVVSCRLAHHVAKAACYVPSDTCVCLEHPTPGAAYCTVDTSSPSHGSGPAEVATSAALYFSLVLELDPMSFVPLFASPLDRGGGSCPRYSYQPPSCTAPPLLYPLWRSCPHRSRGVVTHFRLVRPVAGIGQPALFGVCGRDWTLGWVRLPLQMSACES